MTLALSSSAFKDGDSIPARYTDDGQDVSPPLSWEEPPTGTEAFVLIMDDPDAPGGIFTHWILFNLPATVRQLPEGVPSQPELANSARQGRNDFGRTGYGGPAPPPGRPHRYVFTLYALDQPLELKAGATVKQVSAAVGGHILARGQLTGTHQR